MLLRIPPFAHVILDMPFIKHLEQVKSVLIHVMSPSSTLALAALRCANVLLVRPLLRKDQAADSEERRGSSRAVQSIFLEELQKPRFKDLMQHILDRMQSALTDLITQKQKKAERQTGKLLTRKSTTSGRRNAETRLSLISSSSRRSSIAQEHSEIENEAESQKQLLGGFRFFGRLAAGRFHEMQDFLRSQQTKMTLNVVRSLVFKTRTLVDILQQIGVEKDLHDLLVSAFSTLRDLAEESTTNQECMLQARILEAIDLSFEATKVPFNHPTTNERVAELWRTIFELLISLAGQRSHTETRRLILTNLDWSHLHHYCDR